MTFTLTKPDYDASNFDGYIGYNPHKRLTKRQKAYMRQGGVDLDDDEDVDIEILE